MYTQGNPSLLVASLCSHLALLLITASEPLDWWRESWSRSGPLVVGLLTTAAALGYTASIWVKEETTNAS